MLTLTLALMLIIYVTIYVNKFKLNWTDEKLFTQI